MANYTLERESGWLIVVGPGLEKGTGKYYDGSKSYLLADAQELRDLLQKAYDAGRLQTLDLVQGGGRGDVPCPGRHE